MATTPVGLGDSLAFFPRVAEYSNPGLEDRISAGLGDSLAVFPRVAEYGNPGLEDRIPFGENVQTLTHIVKEVASLGYCLH